MESPELQRAVDAGTSTARALGLRVDHADVLQNSNRIAVHLTPCNVLARVGPLAYRDGLAFEVEIGRSLADTGAPVAAPEPRAEPRVYADDGFAVTLWTYHEPLPHQDVAPDDYARVLRELHDGMARIDAQTPHFTDRVAEAHRIVDDHKISPELGDSDRQLLDATLEDMTRAIRRRGAPEQLLHGEPHDGNLLRTNEGLLFVDLETCCRGPVEFDVAHTPFEVAAHYAGLDHDLVRDCRILMAAMVTTWRWRDDDQLPNGRYWRTEGLKGLRSSLRRRERDVTG